MVDTISEGQTKQRILLFDCLVMQGERVTDRPLSRRYASLQMQLYPAFTKCLHAHPDAQMMLPFEIQVKPMDLAYGLDVVIKDKIPRLLHGNDGLIFSSLEAPYVFGTNPKILKWKPPHENTIDFQLQLRFPPDTHTDPSGSTPDYAAKPLFQLWQHDSGLTHTPFDWLDMSDDEWERWKLSGQQLDDRIVECAWHSSPEQGEAPATWHIKRLRDDKTSGNHKSTVLRILQSMQDAVSENELLDMVPLIRKSWKSPERMSKRAALLGKSTKGRPAPPFTGLHGPPAPTSHGGMPHLCR